MKKEERKINEEEIDFWISELNKVDGNPEMIKQYSDFENQSFFEKSEEQMKTINTFRNIYDTDTDAAWKKLHKRFEKDGLLSKENHDKNFRIKKIFGIAAGFALLLTFSVFAYYYLNNPKADLITVSADVSTGIKTVKLPDGTNAVLNIGSQIRCPKTFSGDIRKIELSGEAFFKVTKNAEKPFIITASNTEIKVVGTAFNVKTDENKTEVVVSEGHVQFYLPEKKKEKVDLLPGDAGLYQNNKLTASKNDNPNFMSWKTKIFTISENMNLARVIEDLNQTYQVHILFDKPEIGNIIPSPTVFDNYSLDAVLKILCTQSNLKTRTENEKIILTND
jgi:ferric-dicitrate binding protein FerR (iron transport regulator)